MTKTNRFPTNAEAPELYTDVTVNGVQCYDLSDAGQVRAEAEGSEIDVDSYGCAFVREISPLSIVTVETMPDHLRQSHRAAHNWGVYPHNGSERRQVTREEANEIVAVDEDGYDHIVE